MDTVSKLIKHGQFLRERARYEESIAAIMEALSHDPDRAESHAELGLTYYQHPDSDHSYIAIRALEHAIGLDPEEAYYYALKSQIEASLGYEQEALETVEIALTMDSDNSLAWTTKGLAHLNLEQYEESHAALQIALRLDPDDTFALNLMAILHREQSQVLESGKYVALALAIDPENALTLANKSWCHLLLGERQVAEELFLESLRINPNDEYARAGLKHAYKSRSMLYANHLRLTAWMKQMTSLQKSIALSIIIAGAITVYCTLPALPLVIQGLIGGAILLLFCWTPLAETLGNMIILKDTRARAALDSEERTNAWSGYFGLIFGVAFVIYGLIQVST